MINILMVHKISLKRFLESPGGEPSSPNSKFPTLEELGPFIIYFEKSNGNLKTLTDALTSREKEFYINPTPTETPVNGFPVYLDEIIFTD